MLQGTRPRARTTHRTGTALLALALATACAPSGGGSWADEGALSPDGPTPGREPAEETTGPVTVAFGGDVMFEGLLRPRLQDPETALDPISEQLSASDLAVVNLETAVTGGGTPAPGKDFTFRAPESALEALEHAGVDAATLANNHGMDYGTDGLLDTLDHGEDSRVELIGAGRDSEEAYEPFVAEVNGQSLAVLGATDVIDEHLVPEWTAGEEQPGLASTKYEMREHMVDAVAEAAQTYDNVAVFLHWGLEGAHCPLPHAPGLAEELVEAGAAAVVGGHAHVLSPGGYMGDSYVHYGLGNFVFYNFAGPNGETGVLTLTFDGGSVVDSDWAPARIEDGVPVPYEGQEAEDAHDAWVDMRQECDLPLSDSPA